MVTLVFSTDSSFVARAIRFFTRSRCSHVMIGLELEGIPVLLHSTAGGVQVTPRRLWFKSNRMVDEYRIRPEVDVRAAAEKLGQRYDYVALIGYALLIVAWRWFRVKVKNVLASPGAVVCSEFVLELDRGGDLIVEWRGLDPERTHAQDLLAICERSPGSFERV